MTPTITMTDGERVAMVLTVEPFVTPSYVKRSVQAITERATAPLTVRVTAPHPDAEPLDTPETLLLLVGAEILDAAKLGTFVRDYVMGMR